VVLYIGIRAWQFAERRRIALGTGTALVLPPELDPEHLLWPALDELVIVCLDSAELPFLRQSRLMRALARDCVRKVAIEFADAESCDPFLAWVRP
jgi:hypothetical protein